MTKLPTTGPLPKPKSPDEAREVLKAEAFPAPNTQRVALTATEFTSICPRTGQPDFATMTVRYVPKALCVELKSLKLYLWSFRDEGHFHEDVTNRILDDLVALLKPRQMSVVGDFNVRGGIHTVVTATHKHP